MAVATNPATTRTKLPKYTHATLTQLTPVVPVTEFPVMLVPLHAAFVDDSTRKSQPPYDIMPSPTKTVKGRNILKPYPSQQLTALISMS